MGEGISGHRSLLSEDREVSHLPQLARILTGDRYFQQVLGVLPRFAATDLPVLITGEPGTGKELVAEALFALSPRSLQGFHRLNCALLGGELATSELFGHLKGSFTGAAQTRLGKFQLAHQGTLFLDEVGDLDPAVQPRLLRAVEQGEVESLGSDTPARVDVRLICATNQNLDQLLAEGRFRQDLFDRLAVLVVGLPPLRERGEDVLLLAEHFLEQEARRYRRPVVGLSAPAKRRLKEHPWFGNVRELRNAITRAVLFSSGHLILATDLVFAPRREAAPALPRRHPAPMTLPSRPPRENLAHLIREEAGNISAVARRLQVCSRTIYRWLRAYGLELTELRPEDVRMAGVGGGKE